MGDTGNQIVFSLFCLALLRYRMLQLHTHLINAARDLAQFITGNFRNLMVELSAGNFLQTTCDFRQVMIPICA
ncbi:hypothetical protein D3C76_1657330 [compost metagenome]